MSKLADALNPYLDQSWSPVSLYPGGGHIDNPSLITLHAMNLMRRLGDHDYRLEAGWAAFARACSDSPLGMPRRWPDDWGDTSYDEAIGQAGLSAVAAKRIWNYGMRHWFCYDVRNPDMLSWRFFFARNIAFVPYIAARAKKPCAGLLAPFWCVGLLLSPWTARENTSGKLLMDAQVPEMERFWIARVATRAWVWVMARKYTGRKDLYSIYMPAGHPLAEMQPEGWR